VIVCKGWRVEGRVGSGYVAVGLGWMGQWCRVPERVREIGFVLYLVLFGVYV
jgi:hypothetical protein